MRTIRTSLLVALVAVLCGACGGSSGDVTIATDDPPPGNGAAPARAPAGGAVGAKVAEVDAPASAAGATVRAAPTQ